MAERLEGTKMAFFAAPEGTEQVELVVPWERLTDAGAELELVSLEAGQIRMVNHREKGGTFAVDQVVGEVTPDDYDGLVLPGGVANPDFARTKPEAVAFVRGFFDRNKPVAAICHAPWMLVEADVVRGRTLTSWPSLRTDIRNAGGTWVDEQVVAEPRLVTSRKPDDLEAFSNAAIEMFAEAGRSRSAA